MESSERIRMKSWKEEQWKTRSRGRSRISLRRRTGREYEKQEEWRKRRKVQGAVGEDQEQERAVESFSEEEKEEWRKSRRKVQGAVGEDQKQKEQLDQFEKKRRRV